jgi:hypothetical protein
MGQYISSRVEYAVSFVAGGGLSYAQDVRANATFSFPFGIAYQFDAKTAAAQLLVADGINDRIRAVDLKTGSIISCC